MESRTSSLGRNAGLRIPDEIASASDLVLFAGTGLSMQCGYASMHSTLAELTTNRRQNSESPHWELVNQTLAENDCDAAIDILTTLIPRTEIIAKLTDEYVPARPARPPWTLFPHLDISDAITPGWDPLVVNTFKSKNPIEVTPSSSSNLEGLFDTNRFCIVRLNGLLTGGSPILTYSEYNQALARNPTFLRHLVSLVLSRSHLFLGASAKTVYNYLSSLPLPSEPSKKHFAFITSSARFEREAARLRRFGVHAFPIDPSDPGKDLYDRLKHIYLRQDKRYGNAPLKLSPYNLYRPLRQLELHDIGPFHQLRIDFRDDVNIILGNNGCGKSSILRALTLALAGDHPSLLPAAESLLKSEAKEGSIRIVIGEDSYGVDLRREGSEVRVKTSQASPIELGVAFPIAFPAFRGISGADPAGPGAGGATRASIDDILPLSLAATDGRLANIKQWLVNLEAASERRSDIDRDTALRNKRLFDTFFRVMEDFLAGLPLTFERIEKSPQRPWRVLVRTADGVLAFSQLAQGMNSVIALAGTLLQRLYEVNTDSEAPEKEPAIMIADEIDAHMHPSWQQQIIQLLRKHFPKVQIIASTHSPLVVSGVDVSGITRLVRTPRGSVEVGVLQEDDTRGRADQLLTSPLFGLATTLDPSSRHLLSEYRYLLAKTNRSQHEEVRLQELRNDIRVSIPPPDEGAAVRRAQQLLSLLLRSEAGELNPEYESRLLAKASKALVQALSGPAES